tara:strand:+ start:294 stop:506 length:213 start_codon:yes stop_codon:yes gene_type:complete
MLKRFRSKQEGVYVTMYFPDPEVLEELDERCAKTRRSRNGAIYDLIQKNKYWEGLIARTLKDQSVPMGVI